MMFLESFYKNNINTHVSIFVILYLVYELYFTILFDVTNYYFFFEF